MTRSLHTYTPDCGHCLHCAIHHMKPVSWADALDTLLGPNNRMWLCPDCGNKRCPHATDHRLPCTQSNEPNQPGSQYQQRYFGDEANG